MIKNLYFDMGGVVTQQDSQQAFDRFRRAGVTPLEDYMSAHGQQGIFREFEAGRMSEETFCRELAVLTHRDEVPIEEASYCWRGFFKDIRLDHLAKLEELRQHYRLCLLTNTNSFMMGFTRSEKLSPLGKGLGHYFHAIYTSYEIKAYKPDAEFFLKVLAAEGARADECLFIDDSLNNIRGAENVGIRGLHVPTNGDWVTPLDQLLLTLNANL